MTISFHHIDPTINYETNAVDQDQVADNIKKSHCESCIPDLQSRYAIMHPVVDVASK